MQEFEVNPEHIMKDVYSYPFPEVRDLLREQQFDPDLTINTITRPEAQIMLSSYNFDPPLDLPVTNSGSIDLDELHLAAIERIRLVQERFLPGLSGFSEAYPMHGSSQAMFNLMAEWSAKGKMESLAVIDGEYDGYAAYAKSLNIKVECFAELADASVEPGRVWFVSNPNARAGNWIDSDAWQQFVEAGHNIVLDAAYVGLTSDQRQLDVSSPNIMAVLTSPSKIFGVFRYRNTGVTYVREPVECMYGSKWFKDIPALFATLSLYENFGDGQLAEKYRSTQELICRELGGLVGAVVVPSDVLLLAKTEGPIKPQYDTYRRADGYRFGLTKLFEDYEKEI